MTFEGTTVEAYLYFGYKATVDDPCAFELYIKDTKALLSGLPQDVAQKSWHKVCCQAGIIRPEGSFTGDYRKDFDI